VEVVQGPVNFKGLLQEISQGTTAGTPVYAVVESEGPSHRRHWRVEALLNGKRLGIGEGRTRRSAEQEAARHAIEKLNSR
jgi:ribonuclease-3